MKTMSFLQCQRTHWPRFAVIIAVASLAIIGIRYALPSWLFSDTWTSAKWLKHSGHDRAIFKLHVVDDTLVSVGMDGVIAVHNKVTLEVVSRTETHGEIKSSTVFREGDCVIVGHADGNISIVRLNQNPPVLDTQLLVVASNIVGVDSLFESAIDAIAIESTLNRPQMVVCSDGKVHVGQVNFDDNSMVAMKEIVECRYGGSSVSVVSPEPNIFAFSADFMEDLKVIRTTGDRYSISNIISSAVDLPRYSGIVTSPSGKFACTLSWRGNVSCSDVTTERELWIRQGYFPGHLLEAFWISDYELVTFAGFGSFTRPPGFTKWNVESGSIIRRWQLTEHHSVSCVAAYPDLSRIVLGTTDGRIGEISLLD